MTRSNTVVAVAICCVFLRASSGFAQSDGDTAMLDLEMSRTLTPVAAQLAPGASPREAHQPSTAARTAQEKLSPDFRWLVFLLLLPTAFWLGRRQTGKKADERDAKHATVIASFKKYRDSTRGKIVRISQKFDAMLKERNELVARLQEEQREHDRYRRMEREHEIKSAAIARLESELDEARALIATQDKTTGKPDATLDDDDTAVMRAHETRRELTQAQRQIRGLEADLRVRSDVISAFEEDTSKLPKLEHTLESKESTIAVLQNELNLAVTHIARLQDVTKGDAGSRPPTGSAELRQSLQASEQRVARQADIIAGLEEALLEAGSGDREMHAARIADLQQDLRASSSLIRYLEDEVAQLTRGSRAAPGGG